MNISKINAQISEFCLASGFVFGNKLNTAENTAKTKTFIKAEYLDWCITDNQTHAAKEMIDIAYFTLTEFWQYGVYLLKPDIGKYTRTSITWFVGAIADLIEYENFLLQGQFLHAFILCCEKWVTAYHFDFEKVFDAVHQSNMSKFLTNKADVEPSIFKNLQLLNPDGTQRYKSVGCVEQGGKFVIKCLETGKILKGIHYKEPDLSNCQNF